MGSGDSCSPTVNEDRPLRGPDERFTTADTPTVLHSTSFGDAELDAWTVISGTWEESLGSLAQIETCDFDATALLDAHAVRDFRWEATFTGDSSPQGGLLINQQSEETRSGASLIDVSDDGSIVRWGSYDERGYYTYVGAEAISPTPSGEALTLSVEVHGAEVEISVNDTVIGGFTTQFAGGQVGLVATQSAVSFSSATLTVLPTSGGAS